MRVLHVVPSLHPSTGGPARSVPALVAAVRNAGVDAELATFRRAGDPWTLPEPAPFPAHAWIPRGGTRQFPSAGFIRNVARESAGFDLVHLHSVWTPAITASARAAIQARRPFLLTPRGMLQGRSMRNRRLLKGLYRAAWDRPTLERASRIHFFTAAERDDSRAHTPAQVPTFVLPNGTDPAAASEAKRGAFRASLPELGDAPFALFVGRLHWSKGLEIQLEAFRRLRTRLPDFRWVFVGPDGGDGVGLRRLAEDLGLGDAVVWAGSRPKADVLSAYLDASCFVLTSIHEAHSMALNEALAVGVPTVLTATVDFPEVAAWGAGLVVDWNARAVAHAVAHVVTDPRQAAAMRDAGRQAAREHLAWDRIGARMKAEYEDILQGPHPAR